MQAMRKSISVIFLCFAFLFFQKTSGQSLDTIKDTSQLSRDLKDLYKAFDVNHIISDQNEVINFFLNEDPQGLNRLLSNYIKICESIKKQKISNKTLKDLLEKYVTATVNNYQVMQSKGFKSIEFKKDNSSYTKVREKYMNYLMNTYATDHFVNLTEEKYWQVINKSNYAKDSRLKSLLSPPKGSIKMSLRILDTLVNSSQSFQEKSIYQIALADLYVTEEDLGVDARDTAINIYKSILDQRKYSLYLFESWLKWRAVSQEGKGLSKSSEIPNNEYDKVREQVAATILKHILKDKKDQMAINEFLLMATHDIIRRFGDYPYGNQNTVEFHQIFDKE